MQLLETLLPYLQIIVAVLLVTAILLQQRGSGLGSAFGGEGGIYTTKRGFEKWLFRATVVLGIFFVLLALLNLVIKA